jgi:hypothetical protein
MYIHTILPTYKSSIVLPSHLVKSEMTKKIGIKFSGTIYYCPENQNGFNYFDPKVEGALVGLIQQILLTTNDYILLFENEDIISKNDYHDMSDIPGIERVFIVNIGQSIVQVDNDFQLDASIFSQYFQKDKSVSKKRWLLSVNVKSEDDLPLKKQKNEVCTPVTVPVSTHVSTFVKIPVTESTRVSSQPSTPGSEGGRRTPTHPSNYWEEKDITRCAWSQEILPNHIEKLPAYKVYGISEIKNIPVPVDSKSHMICNYSNGKIYMNQKTQFERSDFSKMSQLILSGCGRKVYSFNRVVGYYETDKMLYHHY